MSEREDNLVRKLLTVRLKCGDTEAFNSIFCGYYKDLVLFANRFTKNLDIAEEIVQDTFVLLWDKHEILDIETSIKSYMLKAVKNKCIDLHRHNLHIKDHVDSEKWRSDRYVNDTENYILHSELQEQIDKALLSLPDKISETFRMNRYKGLKYNEIANILGVSQRTIEDRIGKALNMLRCKLKDYLVILLVFYVVFSS